MRQPETAFDNALSKVVIMRQRVVKGWWGQAARASSGFEAALHAHTMQCVGTPPGACVLFVIKHFMWYNHALMMINMNMMTTIMMMIHTHTCTYNHPHHRRAQQSHYWLGHCQCESSRVCYLDFSVSNSVLLWQWSHHHTSCSGDLVTHCGVKLMMMTMMMMKRTEKKRKEMTVTTKSIKRK